MEAWIGLVGTAAGTIGGAMVGAAITLRGARRLNRNERIAAERSEALRAYRVFVAEAVKSVAELRRLPPVPSPKLVENASEAL